MKILLEIFSMCRHLAKILIAYPRPFAMQRGGGSTRACFVAVTRSRNYRLRFLTLMLLTPILSHAGTITGSVRAHGKPEAVQDLMSGKYDSHKYKFAERINYAEL